MTTENKLCQAGAVQAKKRGQIQKCITAEHEGICTATIPAEQSIGDEYRWASNCVEDLLKDDLRIKYFTTDCDSPANAAAGDCYRRAQIEHSPPCHLKDTQHLGRGQRRKIINTPFSRNMFPGRLSADRTKSKVRFADDVVKRCAAEHKEAYTRYNGEHAKVKRALSYSVECNHCVLSRRPQSM